MRFVSSLTTEQKHAALYLLDHHPRLWRLIHRELSTLIGIGAGQEIMILRASARIVAAVGAVLMAFAVQKSKQLMSVKGT